MLNKIENSAQVQRVEYCPSYSAICKVGNAPFYGEITIVYFPKDDLLEFESFEEWLRSMTLNRFTIESFCREVFDALEDLLGDVCLSVEVYARTTVHGPVICSISQNEKERDASR